MNLVSNGSKTTMTPFRLPLFPCGSNMYQYIEEKPSNIVDIFVFQWTILQFCAQLPGLWIKARLELTLLWYKPHCFSYVNHVVVVLTSFYLHKKSIEVCIKAKSTPASLLFKDLVTEHRTVKWSINRPYSYSQYWTGTTILDKTVGKVSTFGVFIASLPSPLLQCCVKLNGFSGKSLSCLPTLNRGEGGYVRKSETISFEL